ncbi:MAG: serine/threonine-protein kinase [Acidobacteriota bacterium]
MIRTGEKKGDFLIKAEIGKGGMGTIYYAIDTMLNREIALKVIHTELANNEQLMERFKIEAMTQAQMNHPNIVMIFSFIKIENENVIVMEFIDGKNMKDLLTEKRILSITDSIHYIKQVLKGLEFSHSRNIIHRDIKPANILITKKNNIKLSDFGIAKVFGKQGLTKTGMLLGTPWYSSPEQILGHKVDFRSDLYSVGVTFFEMVTGQVPFDSETNSDFQIQKAHLETPPPRPSIYNPEIGSKVEKFILKALQKKPEKRFQSATEMLEEIESLENKIIETQIVQKNNNRKQTVLEERIKNGSKTKPLLWTLSVILVLLMAGLTYLFVFKGDKKITKLPDVQQENYQKEEELVVPEIKQEETLPADEEKKPETNKNEIKKVPVKTIKKEPVEKKKEQKNVIATGTETKKIKQEKIKKEETVEKKEDSETKIDNVEKTEPEKTDNTPAQDLNININIEAELLQLKTLMENRDFKKATEKADFLLQNSAASPKLYSIIGGLKFFTGKYSEAEEYWKKTLNNNGSVVLQFFHKHGVFNKGCSGQLILKKGIIIFDSMTKPSHSFAVTADKIKYVKKPKGSFGIEISFFVKNKAKKNTFILKRRNRKGEVFLSAFINNYILGE